ncbi:hypothetical protein BVY01_02900 [bacterium I07]|nr:hypothetical protein BVY01_02900 [bacterium I07]
MDKETHLYRFETNDPEVNKRMRQRQDFKLVGFGVNHPCWQYQASFYSPKEAKRTLGRITRSKVKFVPSEDLFVAKTGAIVALKEKIVNT